MIHDFSECPSAFPDRYIVSGDCNHVHPYYAAGAECWRFRVQADQKPDENGRIRSEVKDRKPGSTALVPLSAQVPCRVQYGFSFLIPGDWVKDPNKVALVHWHHTPADPALTVPPLSLFLWNNNLYLRMKNDGGLVDLVKTSFLPVRDQWVNGRVGVTWSPHAAAGHIAWSLSVGGVLGTLGPLVFTRGERTGPTCQAAVQAIYNSIGPYLPDPTPGIQHTVYFKEWDHLQLFG